MLQPGDTMLSLAGYLVPAADVESTTVYTNTVPGGHDRAPGQPQNAFAAESHMDLIARGMGIDPLELRERNAIKDGEIDVTGAKASSSQVAAVLARLRTDSRWGAPLPAGRGRGCAVGVRHVGRGKSSLLLRMEADGAIEIVTGVSDQGGGQHTLFQRLAAAELDVPLDRIRIRRGTTAEVLVDAGVGGSRVTPVQGNAVLDGARKLKALLAEGRTPPFEVEGTASQEHHEYGAYAYAVEVEVDRETGQAHLRDVLLVADVGTVINPVALRGQLEGGFAFGLGQAVMEELVVEDGRVATPNLGDYKLPTIADVPAPRVVLLTDAPGPGPFGAKSVGELANPAIGPAIANAIHDAVGARVRSLPLSAEKILRALTEADGGTA
jgi:CO/xanthine dehydrogenase Mo-binding subunit